MMEVHHVYAINGKLGRRQITYVGSTTRENVWERIQEHEQGLSVYTSKLTAKKVVLVINCGQGNARSVEFFLKRHRNALQQMIKGNLQAVSVKSFYEWVKKTGVVIYDILWGDQIDHDQ